MNYKKSVLSSQKDLKTINQEKDAIHVKAKYGPSKITRIPFELKGELSFFVGAIIGDGHLKKSKLQITIELSDKKLINYIRDICKDLFEREFNVREVKLREGKKQTWVMIMDSKAIYNLLKDVFEISPGKKSHIVKVPEFIKKSNEKIKISFLKGIMATEGGRRRRGYGLSTASEELWKGLIILFNDINIPVLKDSWIYQKYKKKYYGISFREEHMKRLMWECRSGQTGDA